MPQEKIKWKKGKRFLFGTVGCNLWSHLWLLYITCRISCGLSYDTYRLGSWKYSTMWPCTERTLKTIERWAQRENPPPSSWIALHSKREIVDHLHTLYLWVEDPSAVRRDVSNCDAGCYFVPPWSAHFTQQFRRNRQTALDQVAVQIALES